MAKALSLKLHQRYFGDVEAERKTYEVRRDDRGYQLNDVLFLNEVDDKGEWTRRTCLRQVCHILRHEDFPEGIQEGFVVLGLRPL